MLIQGRFTDLPTAAAAPPRPRRAPRRRSVAESIDHRDRRRVGCRGASAARAARCGLLARGGRASKHYSERRQRRMVDLLRLGEDRRQRMVPPPAVHRARLTDGFATQRRRAQCAGDPGLRRPNARQFLLAAAARRLAEELELEAARRGAGCVLLRRCLRPGVAAANARPRIFVRSVRILSASDSESQVTVRRRSGSCCCAAVAAARSLSSRCPAGGSRMGYAAFRGRLARTCRSVAYFRSRWRCAWCFARTKALISRSWRCSHAEGSDDRRRRRLRRRAGGEARGLLRVKVAAPPSPPGPRP